MPATRIAAGRPHPATVLALAILILATSGMVAARPSEKDEVTLVTLTGSADTTGPFEMATIPLNDSDDFTFTLRAGEALQLIASFVADEPPDVTNCDATNIVWGEVTPPGPLPVGAQVDMFSDRGEFGQGSDVGGLAAATTDRVVTLHAFTREGVTCDADPPLDEFDGPDTWSVTLTLTVVTLRN